MLATDEELEDIVAEELVEIEGEVEATSELELDGICAVEDTRLELVDI